MTTAIIPGSPAELAGICVSDEIMLVNEHSLKNNFHDWCAYYGNEEVKLAVVSQSFRKYVTIKPIPGKEFFPSYFVVKIKDATAMQKEAYQAWAKKEF